MPDSVQARVDTLSERSNIPIIVSVPIDDQLLARIRGEYEEMPGLRLDLPQACRLWQLHAETCLALLEELVARHYLHRTHNGAYAAFPSMRPRPAKASLSTSQSTAAPKRRPA